MLKNAAVVVIADDHAMFAEPMRRLLARSFAVEPIVTSLCEVPAVLKEVKPDILLLDLMFGRRNALDEIPLFLQLQPTLKVIIVTGYSTGEYIERGFKNGARGFVDKADAPTDLMRAIKSVLAGDLYVDGSRRAIAFPDRCHLEQPLTECEREALTLLQQGLAYPQIAMMLNLSVRTIEDRAGGLRSKLGIKQSGRRVRRSHVRIEGEPEPDSRDQSIRPRVRRLRLAGGGDSAA